MKTRKILKSCLLLSCFAFAMTSCQGKASSAEWTALSPEPTKASSTRIAHGAPAKQEVADYEVYLDFTPIEVPEPNIMAENGYFERENKLRGQTIAEIEQEETDGLNLTPVEGLSLPTGHTVYTKNGTTSPKYIISGTEYVRISGTELTQPNLDNIHILRKEGSGERIRVFWDDEHYEAMVNSWNDGVSILKGEAEAPEDGCIILNGCLVEGAKPRYSENWTLYLPLRQIAENYSEYSGLKGANELHYYLAVAQDSDVVKVPCQTSYDTASQFGMSDYYYTWTYRQNGQMGIVLELNTPEEYENFYMKASNISQILGWEISLSEDGRVVNIVTDPLDVTKDFINLAEQAEEEIEPTPVTESTAEPEQTPKETVTEEESKVEKTTILKRLGLIFISFAIFVGIVYAIVYYVREHLE